MERHDGMFVGIVEGVRFLRENATEPYVCIPPALLITTKDGDAWSLGSEYLQTGGWSRFARFYWNVVRNGVSTGEFADKIEYRRGVLRIFTQTGVKVLSRSARHFI
jgi:hypothetical protein